MRNALDGLQLSMSKHSPIISQPSATISLASVCRTVARKVTVTIPEHTKPWNRSHKRNKNQTSEFMCRTVENISWTYSWVYFLLQRAMGRYLSRLKRRHRRLRCSPLWSAHKWRVKLGEMGKRQVNYLMTSRAVSTHEFTFTFTLQSLFVQWYPFLQKSFLG